jgi:bacterioferritin
LDKKKIIEFLSLDMEDEHGAIIQYLSHAYSTGEGEMACEIEAIARDEMRHFDWLAETIVALGGQPSLKRGTQNMTGKTVTDWMSNNVSLEDGAIKNYQKHIKAIDDPVIKRLLKRILSDEQSHRGKFEHFIAKAKKERMKDLRGNRNDKTTKTLDWGIGHEYTVVLQYLFHSYMTKNKEAKKQLEDQAINEMQHLGWLSEEMVSGGGTPNLEYNEPDMSTKTTDMLKADIMVEKETVLKYDEAAKKINVTGIKELLLRIRDHEKYHTDVFSDLLKDEKKK